MDEQMRAALTAALGEAVTVWAVPALIDDPGQPYPGPLPVLLVLPSIVAQTFDGSDSGIDVVTSSLLGSGYTLLSRLDPDQILGVATLPHWEAALDPAGQRLRVADTSGALYVGDLGPEPPQRWGRAARRRRELAVLVASAADASADDIGDQFAAAAAAGRVVGARMPLRTAAIP